MTETIVVGTDGSSCGSQAVIWAAREATWHATALKIVHVLPAWAQSSPPGSRHPEISLWQRTQAHHLLKEATTLASEVAPGIAAHHEVLYGDPADVLAAQARTAYQLVVGNHGLGSIRGLLLGSIAFKLAAHTACPLIVTSRASTGRPWREILVGVDGSARSKAALGFAFEEALGHSANIRALHAWTFPTPLVPVPALPVELEVDEYAQGSAQLLSDALKAWRDKYPTVTVAEDLVCGHPVQTLTRASAEADLLVVGSRGLGGFSGLALGSVSHGILHHAQCSVAIVSPPQPVTPDRTSAH